MAYFSPSVSNLGGIMAPHNPLSAYGDPINPIIPSDMLSPVGNIDAPYGVSAPGHLGGVSDLLSVLSAVDFLFPSGR